MFIGHFGTGFAAKAADNKPSLGTLFFAAQFIDLLWPFFLIFGLEKVRIEPGISAFTPLDFIYYPFSHSLFSTLIWAILFGCIYFVIKRDMKSSIILAFLVVSHWVLDLITHIPDLPLTPWGNYKVGLGLWNSVILTIIIEGIIFITGVYFYLASTKAINKKGNIGLWSLVIFLVIVYFLNIIGPPPNESAIGFTGLSQWIIIIWGYWINKNRISSDKFSSELLTTV